MRVSARPEADFDAALADGAHELGVLLDERQRLQLAQFGALLQRWNRVHNLTAIDRADQLLTHHLLDSLATVPEIAAHTGAQRLLDVGSGGGLPGVPVAIALPHLAVTLVDKVQKKAAFLEQAKLELALVNVDVRHARVENLDVAPFDIITARALTSLDQLIRWTRPLLAPGGCWIALKGALPSDEIDVLEQDRSVVVVRTVKIRVPHLEAERHLVVVETQ